MEYISISAIILGVVIIISLLYHRMFGGNTQKSAKKPRIRDRDKIILDANKRLALNPKDQIALQSLGDLYFSENTFDKSTRFYKMLASLLTGTGELDEYTIYLRLGLSAAKIESYDEARKALLMAKAMKNESPEANFYLGFIEFQQKAYDKALPLFRVALKINTEHAQSIKYYGLTLKKANQYKEALRFLKMSVDRDPSDKETLYELGETYNELGLLENALRVFSHLRPDPVIGPKSSLYAATLNFNSHQYEAAGSDLDIGLKHQNIPREVFLELKYRQVAVFVQLQDLNSALRSLREIRNMEVDYKDVNAQIQRLTEFSANKNLHVFMVSPDSEFLTLCKALTMRFIKNANVKILDVTTIKNEYADILAEVSTSKYDDLILFRYIRTNGQIGEIVLREMYTRIRELKAGRGFCVSAGEYTQGARQFVEARLIDLINKSALDKALAQMNS